MIELPELSPDEVATNRAAWLAALESGNFPQTQGLLRTDDGYCCLGVAENVRGAEWQEDDGEYGVPNRLVKLLNLVTEEPLTFPETSRNVTFGAESSTMTALLSSDGIRWLGVLAADPYVVAWDDEDGWVDVTLTALNDDWRLSFAQIAAVIRDQAPDWNGYSSTVAREVARRVAEDVPRPAYAHDGDR